MSFGTPFSYPLPEPEIVRASIDIAASPAEVFRALADPRELAAWLGADPSPAEDAGPRRAVPPGGAPVDSTSTHWSARVVGPDGRFGIVEGDFTSVVPPHSLETTWRASWSGHATEHVVFRLAPIDVGGVAGTRVTVTHTRATALTRIVSSEPVGNRTLRAPEWSALLGRLAVHVGYGALGDSFEALHRAVRVVHGAK